MMIEWADLTEAHIDAIDPHTSQLEEWLVNNRKDVLQSTVAKTFLVNAKPLLIGGIWQKSENYYFFWAMFDKMFHVKHSRAVIRGMKVFLAGAPLGRIECTVNAKNEQIIKMLKLMGFALEGRLRYYYSGGDDAFVCSYIGGGA